MPTTNKARIEIVTMIDRCLPVLHPAMLGFRDVKKCYRQTLGTTIPTYTEVLWLQSMPENLGHPNCSEMHKHMVYLLCYL